MALSPVTRAEAAATALAFVADGSGVAALLHDEDGSLASLVGLGLAATAAAGGVWTPSSSVSLERFRFWLRLLPLSRRTKLPFSSSSVAVMGDL